MTLWIHTQALFVGSTHSFGFVLVETFLTTRKILNCEKQPVTNELHPLETFV